MTSEDFERAQLRLDIEDLMSTNIWVHEMTEDEKELFATQLQAYFERRD